MMVQLLNGNLFNNLSNTIVISVLLMAMLIIFLKKQHKIQIKARRNYLRVVASILVALIIVIFFWSNDLTKQIQLSTLSILILVYGFANEGLGKNEVIKFGIMDGHYDHFSKIALEKENARNKYTRIHFCNCKNSSTPLVVKASIEKTKQYLIESKLLNNQKIAVKTN